MAFHHPERVPFSPPSWEGKEKPSQLGTSTTRTGPEPWFTLESEEGTEDGEEPVPPSSQKGGSLERRKV